MAEFLFRYRGGPCDICGGHVGQRVPHFTCRSQWPRGLRHGSAAVMFLGMWVQIPRGDMDICRLWVLRDVRYRSLRRAGHLYRGVQPSVVCVWVWWWSLDNEESLINYELSSYEKELHCSAVNFNFTDPPYSSAIKCWHIGPSEWGSSTNGLSHFRANIRDASIYQPTN